MYETVLDFEIVSGAKGLETILGIINREGYRFAGITQDGDYYTVVFWRPIDG